MKNDRQTATTVKIEKSLYNDFKILGIHNQMTLQDFVERCVYLFVNDQEWRNQYNKKFSPTGSIDLAFFEKNFTGSLS